ncbi:MAG: hypothetical protein P9F19_17400 [Candidatus Contendobacter sp.]|nr:hypothetical protein [Candidatus Contendobacter sp.]MDG4559144.1 hypothetical protein [Candidatus Contendobacter sp.]
MLIALLALPFPTHRNDFNRSCFFGGFALALLIAAIGSEYLPATKIVSTASNIMGLLSLLFIPFATSPLQACIP